MSEKGRVVWWGEKPRITKDEDGSLELCRGPNIVTIRPSLKLRACAYKGLIPQLKGKIVFDTFDLIGAEDGRFHGQITWGPGLGIHVIIR